LDEPTGELDPVASRNIFRILQDLNKTYGMTIIVIEQKIMLLCEFAKHLAVMKEGSLEYYGTVHEVLRNAEELIKTGVNCPRVVSLYNEFLSQKMIEASKTEVCINVNEAVCFVEKILSKKNKKKNTESSKSELGTTKSTSSIKTKSNTTGEKND